MDPTSRVRRHKLWPWLAAGAAALITGVALCEWQGWPFLQRPIERGLSERLKRQVAFGDAFTVHLLGSLRLHTDALTIGPPAWAAAASAAQSAALVRAGDARVAVPYSTLWRLMRGDPDEAPRISVLKFGRVDASLQRDADGRANWVLTPAAPGASAPRRFETPVVDELVIETGRVLLRDDLLKAQAEATVSTSEGGANQSRGLVIDGKGRYSDDPFEFHVSAGGVLPLVAPSQTASAVPLALRLSAGKSRFTFDGSGIDVLSFKGLDGRFTLAGPSLAKVGDSLGVTLPTTAAFVLTGRLGKSNDVWTLKQADLHVGASHLGGEFTFDRTSRIPLLSGELSGERLVLADLLPAFGAPAPGAGNPHPPPGRVLPQREFDVPSLHMMNAGVKLRLRRADLGRLFAQPLEPFDGDLALRGGVLNISQLVARTAGGEVRGSLGIDANPNPAAWTADLRLAGVDLERWLRARDTASRETRPGSARKPGYVSGKLGAHAQLRGKGNSTAKLLASLEGSVQAWVRDGTVSHLMVEAAGIDIAQGLGVLIKGDDQLPMSCAVVQVLASRGTLTPNVAIVDTSDSTLFASGTVSLVDERLALKVTAKPKDKSPLTLRTPVKLEGSFDQPHVSLDARPLERKLAAAAALALVNPLAGIIPLVDLGERDTTACQRTLQQLRGEGGREALARGAGKNAGSRPKDGTP
ncbi:AsmA family protein [Piscinibacter sp.]|uniref:AsmA family protein n=1 Tax=Piscinibacter sp. TaxID=1903157 RepID=UPI002F3F9019